MTKATNHLDNDLGSVKNPSQPRCSEPPPTLRTAALTDISVDVMLALYPDDVVVILHLAKEAITGGVVCVLVESPMAIELERPAEGTVRLEVDTIGPDGFTLKPVA